jgi:hypothetical protein
MFQTLETVRTLPAKKRKLIAFGISLLCTGIIFIMWLSVRNNVPTRTSTPAVTTEYTPGNSFTQSMSQIWGNISSSFGELSGTLNSINISPTIEYQATSTSNVQKKQ